jgi:hypothetical protein
MRSADLHARIARLTSEPTPETQLHPIAHELAVAASRARYPAKSLASFQRHAVAAGLDSAVLKQLVLLANDEIRTGLHTVPPESPAPTTAWLSVNAAAHALLISPRTLHNDWLRTVDGRRRLGWAWWDGRCWRIPEPAVNAATRAAYMAAIPQHEPAAHVASLPSWCERAPSV